MHRFATAPALLLLLSASAVAFQKPDGDSPNDDTELAALIDQLGSRDFRARQLATKELKQAGAKAIPRLLRRVRSGPLELAARSMAIFERAYVGDEEAATAAADVALESLAESKRQAVAEMAKAVLRRNQAVRTRIAIAHLTRLNADFWDAEAEAAFENPERKNVPNPGLNRRVQFTTTSPPRLILDRQWKGGVEGLKYVRRLASANIHIYLIAGVPIPEAAKLELEAAFSNGNVVPRGPVMLGVKASAFGPGVVVGDVETYSSAWNVLKRHDRLTKMDGEELQDFSDLIAILKTHEVGDKVVFEVETIENNKRRIEERVVTLKNWRLPRTKPQSKPDKAEKPATQP